MLPADFSNRVQTLIQLGQIDSLVDVLLAASAESPGEGEIQHLLGWARAQQGRADEAIAHFRKAVRLKPDAAGSLNNLGFLLLSQEQASEAIAPLKAAVQYQPTFVGALTNLGLALARLNYCDHALFFLERALQLEPQCTDAHHYLGYSLMMLGRLAEAEQHLSQALAQQPGNASYLSTLGLLREAQHRPEEATTIFERAVAANPRQAEPWNNLGNIHAAVWGNWDDALRCFEQTLSLQPRSANARYHRGMVELTLGDFRRGWPDHEFRPTNLQKSPERYGWPRWQGEPLAGKTILLHCEQGLGDTLQFIRFAQRVKKLGATVICELQPALLPLLSFTPGIDAFVTEGAPLPPHDFQIPLLSLAGLLGIPENQPPYLFAAPARVDFWKDRLAEIPGFKIGIAWQGEPTFKYDWLRSIPLAQFAPLARLPGHALISLQKHQGLDQIATNRQNVPIIQLQPEIDAAAGPFMDTAAIIQHLDLVVTSDTSIAHLAGGLGVPVWLATAYAPDWRWMKDREDSPWYPTMRLFRQTKVGHWEDVFQRMANSLRTLDP